MAQWYDVSQPIFEGMPVYKNRADKRPVFETTADHSTHQVRETRIHIDAHTGTHIDAPLHMVASGATVEAIHLNRLIRPCRVVDLSHVVSRIGEADLQPLRPQRGEFLLLKTRNSQDDGFNPAFVFLAADGARFLADLGIAGVGIDALGIERDQPGHPTHRVLFEANAVIVEGLRLRDVPAGEYQMVALPLRLLGVEAAPARVVLMPVHGGLPVPDERTP
ncbi:MAG: cyclase family protein [Alicyclobacillaceae bacterium]|nr:cyclase family protein [Alicyclobacillaceae bacterium]